MSVGHCTETWRDVEGYEGLYQVSDLGRVKSLDRMVRGKYGMRRIKGMILSPIPHSAGYLAVSLSNENHPEPLLIHRLVAAAFIDKPESIHRIEVCYYDGNKHNNEAVNLRWDTRESNCADRLRHGVAKKLTLPEVEKIKHLRSSGLSQQAIGDIIGVSQVMVGRILNEKSWVLR